MIQGLILDTLTKKLGPLPIWVWAVLVGGGAGMVLLLRSKQAAANANTTQNADTSSTDASGVASASGQDPYANYLDTSGLYNGYGATDLGSYGSLSGGGGYFPGNYQAPSAPVSTIDPGLLALLTQLINGQKSGGGSQSGGSGAGGKRKIYGYGKDGKPFYSKAEAIAHGRLGAPKPKHPTFSGANPPMQPHTGNSITGGGLPKRNAHVHLVGG